MIFAVLFAYYAYQKANKSNRNGLLWAAIALGAFIGTQLLVGLLIGVFLGIGVGAFGWSENIFDTYSLPINIVAIVISGLVAYLILRYLDKVPDEQNSYTAPPPPNFN